MNSTTELALDIIHHRLTCHKHGGIHLKDSEIARYAQILLTSGQPTVEQLRFVLASAVDFLERRQMDQDARQTIMSFLADFKQAAEAELLAMGKKLK